MKISDVLWKAANEHLWDGVAEHYPSGMALDRSPGPWMYSCDAAHSAVYFSGSCDGDAFWGHLKSFLEDMGVNAHSLVQFLDDEFARVDRQGARYAWLMFASMYAAELEARGEL